MSLRGKRYWIVGASEGLGRALAETLAAEGATLALSARSADKLEALARALPTEASAHPLDLRDLASVRAAAGTLGQIDGVVICAGAYWPMRAAEFDDEKVEAMCDVNLTGAARALAQVVPGFVAHDFGHIVIIGSLSGFRGLPGAIGYGASKAGVMHLAECLHVELRGTGVRVQLVNPGFIRTRLTARNDFRMPQIMEPDEAARHVLAAMKSGRFQTSFPRPFAWLFTLGRFLPRWVWVRLFGR